MKFREAEVKMEPDERKEALENIELIKKMIFQTKTQLSHYGLGWISIIWGIFCLVGVAGRRLLIAYVSPLGALEGVWWLALTIIAGFGTYLVYRSHLKTEPIKPHNSSFRYFASFWIPLFLLGFTLVTLIGSISSLSSNYIFIVMLLIVSTGYIILGLTFFKEILYMGIAGYASSILCAVFFLQWSDIILGAVFGLGLIITGLVVNKQWNNI